MEIHVRASCMEDRGYARVMKRGVELDLGDRYCNRGRHTLGIGRDGVAFLTPQCVVISDPPTQLPIAQRMEPGDVLVDEATERKFRLMEPSSNWQRWPNLEEV